MFVGSAIYGGVANGMCESERETELARRTELERLDKETKSLARRRRERAWTTTKHAATAARAGDCATVRQLDVTIADLDADFHAAVFVRDVVIARCLAKPAE